MAILAVLLATAPATAPVALALRTVFDDEVALRLPVPPDEQTRYAQSLTAALRGHGLWPSPHRYVVLVDRSPAVQALMVFWLSEAGEAHLIGAAPCSTGLPGRFEHFETPLGVFDHTPANPDYRAEGTRNAYGVRGYGVAGMRVFDFGWIVAPRGWGDRRPGTLRLQMHATDPDLLESRLGTPCSKGCIRIPASLNRFLDTYGILDSEYERAAREGRPPRVLLPTRRPVAEAGRYLVVIDTRRTRRPEWSRPPKPASR